jgi:hypothetical protein
VLEGRNPTYLPFLDRRRAAAPLDEYRLALAVRRRRERDWVRRVEREEKGCEGKRDSA